MSLKHIVCRSLSRTRAQRCFPQSSFRVCVDRSDGRPRLFRQERPNRLYPGKASIPELPLAVPIEREGISSAGRGFPPRKTTLHQALLFTISRTSMKVVLHDLQAMRVPPNATCRQTGFRSCAGAARRRKHFQPIDSANLKPITLGGKFCTGKRELPDSKNLVGDSNAEPVRSQSSTGPRSGKDDPRRARPELVVILASKLEA